MTVTPSTERIVTGPGLRARIRRATWIPAVATAVILFVLGGVLSPGYATWQNLNDILAVAAILAIAAAGQTLVIIAVTSESTCPSVR